MKLNAGVMNKTKGYLLVAGVNLVQAVLRIVFSYVGTTDMINEFLTTPVTQTTMQIINISFLALGLAGLVASYGLLASKPWGLKAVAIVSIAAIVFDLWGVTVQFTAALGFIVPALSLIYIYRHNMKKAETDNQARL